MTLNGARAGGACTATAASAPTTSAIEARTDIALTIPCTVHLKTAIAVVAGGLFFAAAAWQPRAAEPLQTRVVDDRALKNAAANGDEWLTTGRDYSEQRYSPLTQIDASNVSRLGLASSYEHGTGGGTQEATPLFSNGVLYGITNWSIVFAVDARTGRELWRYDPNVDRSIDQPGSDGLCCGVISRGVALYQN